MSCLSVDDVETLRAFFHDTVLFDHVPLTDTGPPILDPCVPRPGTDPRPSDAGRNLVPKIEVPGRPTDLSRKTFVVGMDDAWYPTI